MNFVELNASCCGIRSISSAEPGSDLQANSTGTDKYRRITLTKACDGLVNAIGMGIEKELRCQLQKNEGDEKVRRD